MILLRRGAWLSFAAEVGTYARLVQLRLQQEGVVPLLRVYAAVLSFHSVPEQSAVEVGDVASAETAVGVDREEHEGNVVLRVAAEGFVCAAPSELLQIKGCPHVDDADVGVCIESLGELGSLVEHVAFRTASRGVPGQQPLAVGRAGSAGTFGEPALIDEVLVADDARQGYPAQGRIAQRVTAFLVLIIHFNGAELFEAAEAVLNGGFVIRTDDDYAAYALWVQVRKGQRQHAPYAGTD